MKNRFLLRAILAMWLSTLGGLVHGAEKGDPKADLQALVMDIQSKLQAGKNTEKELSAELERFDKLLETYKGEKTDDVAQIVFMKAMLYLQVFDDGEKGAEWIRRLKKDFPETTQGQKADEILTAIEKQEAAKKVQRSLVIGAKFPDFSEKDMAGQPLSIARFKGKVVLVDFWATWCGPCIQELPNVLEAYEKYHEKGFEIIGISLDKDEEKLTRFLKDRKMTWPQYFDGKGWENKLAGQYGVTSIPATYLLDGEGKILGKDLRGDELAAAVAKALKAK